MLSSKNSTATVETSMTTLKVLLHSMTCNAQVHGQNAFQIHGGATSGALEKAVERILSLEQSVAPPYRQSTSRVRFEKYCV